MSLKGTRRLIAVGVAAIGACFLLVGCDGSGDDVGSPDTATRLHAIHDLEREDSAEAAQRLTQAVEKQDAATATEAVWALGRMQNPKAGAALHDLAAKSNRQEVRNTAILALCWQVQRDREDTAQVRDLFRHSAQGDKDATVRATAAGALGVVGSPEDVALLVKVASEDKDVRVQSQSVRAIERLLGGVRFGYDSTAPAADREAVLARVRELAPRFVQRTTGGQIGDRP